MAERGSGRSLQVTGRRDAVAEPDRITPWDLKMLKIAVNHRQNARAAAQGSEAEPCQGKTEKHFQT